MYEVQYFATNDCSGEALDTRSDRDGGIVSLYEDSKLQYIPKNRRPNWFPSSWYPSKAFDNDMNSYWNGYASMVKGDELISITTYFGAEHQINCAKLFQFQVDSNENVKSSPLFLQYLVTNADETQEWITHIHKSDATSVDFYTLSESDIPDLTPAPTTAPTTSPTKAPTTAPTASPTKAPTTAPTTSPTKAPTTAPTPTALDYAMVFHGHDEVMSVNAGVLDISWSPAFVYAVHEDESLDRFVDLGEYTYHIVVAKGEYMFSPDQTIGDIGALASSNPDMHLYTTTERNLQVTGLVGGEKYSVLVLASTAGQESYNRLPAEIQISSVDPVVLVPGGIDVMPEPDLALSVAFLEETDTTLTVEISGTYPDIFKTVQAGDFVYLTGTVHKENGFAHGETDVKLVQVTNSVVSNMGTLEWDCAIKSLYGDVFGELEMDVVVGSANDFDEELVDLDYTDEEVISLLNALPEKVKVDFCIVAYNIEDTSCFDESFDETVHGGRALSADHRKLFLKKLGKKLKKAYTKIKEAAKKVAKKIFSATATLDKTLTFLDIEKSASMVCETEGVVGAQKYEADFEIGLVFDLSAKARFKLQVSLGKGLHNAMVKLFGGFGAKAYLSLGATSHQEFAPDPLLLFKKSKTRTFFAGPVPIVITNRPKIESYIEAEAVVEAEVTAMAQIGWDYDLTFNYDSKGHPTSSRKKFWIDSSFTQREVTEDDPDFSYRASASVELGFLFSWDIILYGTLQASLVTELGASVDLEVSSTLQSIVGTQPYFYILDTFDINGHLRINGAIGFNNPAADIGKTLVDKATNSGPTCTFDLTGKGLTKTPTIGNNNSVDGMPESLVVISEWATNPNRQEAWMDLSLAMVPDNIKDKYGEAAGDVSKVVGQFLDNKKVEFEIYAWEVEIFSLPDIGVNLLEANMCQGNYAITVEMEAMEAKSNALIDNNVNEWQWFGAFDGGTKLSADDSGWEIVSGSDTSSTVTVGLKRNGSPFKIDESMEMFLRATPDKLSSPPKSLMTTFDLVGALSGHDLSFQCCSDSDCATGFACESNGQCKVAYEVPECDDPNPSPLALAAHFVDAAEAQFYCEKEQCEWNSQYCYLWQQNYP
ncbi:MAG: hypothetical protein SGILL_005754 [Bacillariaceae sp.]